MKRTNKISRKQQLKDYNTVANFLMSGDTEEVRQFAKHLDWSAFTIHCWEFMSIDFIRKYKDYIDWGYPIASEKVLSNEFRAEFKEYLEGIE